MELKAKFTPPTEVARQLAAHANAARCEPILWLVGVDERSRKVVGAEEKEVATWFGEVRAQFDTVHPSLLMDLIVGYEGKTFVALLFETDRAPYQVKNPAFNQPGGGVREWEVTWREGRHTRTARREDLVRMLVPASRLPAIELRSCEAILVDAGNGNYRLGIEASLYVVPMTSDLVVFPTHRAELQVTVGDLKRMDWADGLRLSSNLRNEGYRNVPESELVVVTSSEVCFKGPGALNVSAGTSFPDVRSTAPSSVEVKFLLRTTTGAQAIVLRRSLSESGRREGKNLLRQWTAILAHDM